MNNTGTSVYRLMTVSPTGSVRGIDLVGVVTDLPDGARPGCPSAGWHGCNVPPAVATLALDPNRATVAALRVAERHGGRRHWATKAAADLVALVRVPRPHAVFPVDVAVGAGDPRCGKKCCQQRSKEPMSHDRASSS